MSDQKSAKWIRDLRLTAHDVPTSFVEGVADALVRLRHDPARAKTERFGPTGG